MIGFSTFCILTFSYEMFRTYPEPPCCIHSIKHIRFNSFHRDQEYFTSCTIYISIYGSLSPAMFWFLAHLWFLWGWRHLRGKMIPVPLSYLPLGLRYCRNLCIITITLFYLGFGWLFCLCYLYKSELQLNWHPNTRPLPYPMTRTTNNIPNSDILRSVDCCNAVISCMDQLFHLIIWMLWGILQTKEMHLLLWNSCHNHICIS